MNTKSRIAVLMTCHNRRETTLACLGHLERQILARSELSLDIYLVDDGSTDGTGSAVAHQYPSVYVLYGNGQLYWNGGMRRAWREALKGGYEYYLWLNDDTLLNPDAVDHLVMTSRLLTRKCGQPVIVAGAVCDPATGKTTYGGVDCGQGLQRLQFHLITPGPCPRPCHTVHGNCVLVPAEATWRVGILSSHFTHGAGDFDYGLRASRLGFKCWIAPGHVGMCKRHDRPAANRIPHTTNLWDKVKQLHNPTVLPPGREWMCFTRRHGGLLWPYYWLRTLVRICCPYLWVLVRARSSAGQ